MREYFLRTQAAATASRVPDGVRLGIARRVAVGRQRARAADLLWSHGQPAEALHLAARAFTETLDAAKALDEALGNGPEKLHGLADGLVHELQAHALPTLDEEVDADSEALFEKLITRQDTIARAVESSTMTPRALRSSRRTRISVVLFVAVAIAAAVVAYLVRPIPLVITASGVYGNRGEFRGDSAFDDDPTTEWLLPSQRTGWVEVIVDPPARVETVRLLNGYNGPHDDRAVHEYTVELISEGDVAQTIEGSWPEVDDSPEWTEHAADVDAVSKIRVNVLSWHENGGAIAEIAWE